MTRVIVAGTRTFDDYELLREKLDQYLAGFQNIEIISGGARGADTLGERYAKEKGYKLTKFPANWDLYGKSAGYIRNEEMAMYAGKNGTCIVFWDGVSKGSQHMIDLAIKHGVDVLIIKYEK